MNYDEPRYFFFRDTENYDAKDQPEGTPFIHGGLLGTHGKVQSQCKACIVLTVCVSQVADDLFVGFAFRNPDDSFNKKLGKLIAHGRAETVKHKSTRFAAKFTQEKFDKLIQILRAEEHLGRCMCFQAEVLNFLNTLDV